MADRTSARLFGLILNFLAENPTKENKSIAVKIFRETGEFDFSLYQMYCDDALIKLGLAKLDTDQEVLYQGEDY